MLKMRMIEKEKWYKLKEGKELGHRIEEKKGSLSLCRQV